MPPPEIIGREPELERIERFLDRLEEGPAALVLEGQAGAGKTTLWREAVARAEARGCLVLRSRAAESEATLSFAGLADLLGPVLDGVLPALPPPQRRALEVALLRVEVETGVDRLALSLAVHVALLELAAERAVLVAVDDLQWLDDPSAGVLAYALRRLEGSRVGFAASARVEPGLVLGIDLDRAFAPEALARVEVAELGLPDVGRLLEERLGLTLSRPALRRLVELSGGNPFYALEIGRALPAPESLAPGEPPVLPASLAELVSLRLDRLPRNARALLPAVSALSTPDVALVERLDADALEAALGAGALELDGTRVRFTHPLLGSTAYGRLGPARRRRLHRDLAALVDDPEERAFHLALGSARPDRGVAEELEEASARAARRGAAEAAADLANRAASLTPRDDAHGRVRRKLLAADFHFQAGDGERARAALEELTGSLPAGPERAEALHRLMWITEDSGIAIELGERALREADEADPARRAEILTKLARLAAIGGRAGLPERYAQQAVELAEEGGDVDVLARALGEQLRREVLSGRGFDRALARRMLALTPRVRRLSVYESPERNVGSVLALLDHVDEARPLLEGSLRRAADAGEVEGEIGILLHSAELEIRASRFTPADEAVRRSLELERFSGLPDLAYGLALRAQVAALLGRGDEARQAGEEGSSLARATGQEMFRIMNEHALGLLELSCGDMEAAAGRLGPLPERLQGIGIGDPTVFPVVPEAIEAEIGVGALEHAQALVDGLEADGRRLDRPRALAVAARGRALLAEAERRPAEARAWIERSLAEHERLGSDFELARTRLVEGRILRRQRKKGQAKAVLEDALAVFDRLEAPLWAERAREELGRVGLRTRSTGGLTTTESRVAELVAAGHTNKEVAAELFVSVKTVEVYLTRIYRKHGVRSRTELARALMGERAAR
jgi:DNA-binding CsgD family transcriptional regulator